MNSVHNHLKRLNETILRARAIAANPDHPKNAQAVAYLAAIEQEKQRVYGSFKSLPSKTKRALGLLPPVGETRFEQSSPSK